MSRPCRSISRSKLLVMIQELRSTKKKVVRVVSFGGVAPRGHTPTRKCIRAGFQSLLEEDCQRVLEIAPCVDALETHPFVLDLGHVGSPLTYTPDLLVWFRDGTGAIVEIKPDDKLNDARVAARLTAVSLGLARHGVGLVLMLESDARAEGLQTRLKTLLRHRPVRGHWRPLVDGGSWDPERGTDVPEHLRQAWSDAKRECDALLERVMRRDPDDLVPSIQR